MYDLYHVDIKLKSIIHRFMFAIEIDNPNPNNQVVVGGKECGGTFFLITLGVGHPPDIGGQ